MISLRHVIRRYRLIEPGDRVLIALSGGPDSVALALILNELAGDAGAGWSVAGVVHVNHGLRAGDADVDEAFCRAFAARMGWPIHVAAVDVRSRARAARQSIETAAREARDEAFADAASRLGATRIATGHTRDDQAETVLLRLLRGASLRGLSAIRPRRGAIVRPLLDCSRADVLAFLAARGEPFRHDASNDDRSIARNRIRHELLPVIDRIAPGGRAALARLAADAADIRTALDALVAEKAPGIVLSSKDGCVELSATGLAGLTPAIARPIVLAAVEGVAPGARLSSRHLDAIRRLAAADKPAGHLDLPAAIVERRGDRIVVSTAVRARQTAPCAAFERPLPVPGLVTVPEAGVTIAARTSSVAGDRPDGRHAAALQAEAVQGPLTVRSRRPGDRLRPLGSPGRRKLQDVLVDRKVPRAERDRVPIVVDAAGRIVWVAGLAVAEECRVTRPEAGMVILEMRPAE